MTTSSSRWNPWADLKIRRDIRAYFTDLPDGTHAVHQLRGRLHVVVIDADNQVDRNHLLAHELVHIERGGGCPHAGWMAATWGPVVMREEERVETIVTHRLVPQAELLDVAWRACEHEGRLDAWTVADHFTVPQHVAERALWLLDPVNQPAPRLPHELADAS